MTYEVIASEPIVAILAGDHPLAGRSEIDPAELGEFPFIGYTDTPHVLRGIVERYLRERGVSVSSSHFLDSFATGISLVASTGGLTLLPAYVEKLLPRSVLSRPLAGPTPVIEIAVGYRKDNPSPVLQDFLRSIDWLIAAHAAAARQGSPT